MSNSDSKSPSGTGGSETPSFSHKPDVINATGTGGDRNLEGVLSPMLTPQQEALEILKRENLALAEERDNLLEHKRLYGKHATAERDERIRELSNKVKDLEVALSQAKTERSEYEQVLKTARTEALGHYVRMKSTGLTQLDRTQTDNMLQKCHSYCHTNSAVYLNLSEYKIQT